MPFDALHFLLSSLVNSRAACYLAETRRSKYLSSVQKLKSPIDKILPNLEDTYKIIL